MSEEESLASISRSCLESIHLYTTGATPHSEPTGFHIQASPEPANDSAEEVATYLDAEEA